MKILNPVKAVKAISERAKTFSELTAQEKSFFETPSLVWKSSLYRKTEKTTGWHAGLALVTAMFAVYGFLTNSWTFSVVIILASGVYYYLNEQEVPVVDVSVSDFGFKIGERIFPYTDIQTFWIDWTPPFHKELHLVLKDKYKQDITISIHGLNPTDLRQVLTRFLPEWEDRNKTFIENITHFLGL